MRRVGALTLLVVATACSSGSSHPGTSATTPLAASSGPATNTPGALPTPTKHVLEPPHPPNSLVPTSGEPLADGDYFGFLKAIDLHHDVVRVDFAQWVTCRCPNDYSIRNSSKQIWKVPFIRHVPVIVHEGPDSYVGRIRYLATSMTESRKQLFFGAYEGRYGKYWLRVRSGRIVRIDDVFTP
ncbi:MAG: hypothetical protein ACTHK4_03780 [Mycobacteriales bacterium]